MKENKCFYCKKLGGIESTSPCSICSKYVCYNCIPDKYKDEALCRICEGCKDDKNIEDIKDTEYKWMGASSFSLAKKSVDEFRLRHGLPSIQEAAEND